MRRVTFIGKDFHALIFRNNGSYVINVRTQRLGIYAVKLINSS